MVSDYHHFPGIALDPRAELAGLCDTNEELLQEKSRELGVDFVTTQPQELIRSDQIDAIIVATPQLYPSGYLP